MKAGGDLSRPRFNLRWLSGSPLVSCACLAGVTAAIVMGRAVSAVEESEELRAALERVAVQLAAEDAAASFVASEGVEVQHAFDAGKDIEVLTHVACDEEDDGLGLVTAVLGQREYLYRFRILAGGVPDVFTRPLSAVADGPPLPTAWVAPQRFPASGWPVVVGHVREIRETTPALGLTRDHGIALLRLQVGTDREDFLFGNGGETLQVIPPESGVVAVRGNLWVDRGAVPLVVELRRSLTLVVSGNVYLGRSIRVEGPGHLTLIANGVGGLGFGDVDADGRYSRGDVLRGADDFVGPTEGAGNVYVGLPGRRPARVELDLGLVVGGELNLCAERGVIHGAVVLAQGGTLSGGNSGLLVATGRALPDPHRAELPGFAAVGSPRPGRLTLDRQQTLYRAAPTR